MSCCSGKNKTCPKTSSNPKAIGSGGSGGGNNSAKTKVSNNLQYGEFNARQDRWTDQQYPYFVEGPRNRPVSSSSQRDSDIVGIIKDTRRSFG